MAATSRRHSGPILRSAAPSPSPSGRFHHHHHHHQSPSPYTSSSAFASSTSSFSTARTSPGGFFQRSTSPTRVNMCGSTPSSASSVRFSLDRSISPGRSLSAVPRTASANHAMITPRAQKKTCMCSPTNHPGSFRCSLHKNFAANNSTAVSSYSPNRLNARRSAMTNSLVRIGGVEGELVKRALAALIRPSSHQQRRRNGFQPRPSRLSVMSKAEDL